MAAHFSCRHTTRNKILVTAQICGQGCVASVRKRHRQVLQVRLEHMLQRLRVLQDAANTARPTRLLPHLWLSGAVEAHSLHVLRHLGITHVLNATEDLLLPEPEAAFK